MKLVTINLEEYNKDGWYDVDLYPERDFAEEVNILLYKKESWGNIQYYEYFKKMDENNIKVNVFTSLVLFPIASLIGHRCIMHETNILRMYQERIGEYGFDRKTAWVLHDVGNSKNRNWDITNATNEISLLLVDWYVQSIFEYFKERIIYIDKQALELYSDVEKEIPDDCVWLENKKMYNHIFDFIYDVVDRKIIGDDKNFQRNIIEKYEGNKYFLTYQILTSIYKNVFFAAFGGVASLMTAAPLINTMFAMDEYLNVNDVTLFFKNLFNKYFYNTDTFGMTHSKLDINMFNMHHKINIEHIKTIFREYDFESRTVKNIIIE